MLDRSFVAHDQAPTVIHPAKAAFDFPALAIARTNFDRAPAFRLAPLTALNRRDRRLDPSAAQSLAKLIAIVGFVRHQLLRASARAATWLGDTHGGQGRLRQLALMGLGTVHIQANRQALTIGDDHDLAAFADFRFANPRSPFLAGTKLPSRKARVHSSLPWASSWLSNARHLRSQVPSLDHAQKRRQQVAGEPYTRGTSSHVQPVFSTKRMPLSVRRSSFRFRPGPGFCFGIKAAITAHCTSEMSCRLIPQV